MKQASKRVLSLLLAVCLLTSLVPAAFAAGETELQKAAESDGFPYYSQEKTVAQGMSEKKFNMPGTDHHSDRNVYMAVKMGETVRYVATHSQHDPWEFQYWAPQSCQVALVQPVLDGGTARIKTEIEGSGPYTLSYTATLKMSDRMAMVAAVNKDDDKIDGMKFVCHIEDPYLAKLEGGDALTIDTNGIFRETGKRTRTEYGYAVEFQLIDGWNEGTTETVKNRLQEEMTITASRRSVSYEELAGVLEEGTLYTHGWIELSYGNGDIPGFDGLERVIVPADQAALEVESPGELDVNVNVDGTPVDGAWVTITWVNSVDGTAIVREGETANGGKVTFDDIPCGAYKVDVSYQDQTDHYKKSVTYTVDDRDAALTVSLKKAANGGILNTEVKLEGNQSASADNLENAVDTSEIGKDDTVLITLKVEEPESDTAKDQEAQIVDRYGTTTEERGETVFTDFVDATLTEKVNDDDDTERDIKETEGVIEIHIPLSQELVALIDKYGLDVQDTQVYRAHDDEDGARTLERFANNRTGRDGTYYITSYGSDSYTQYYAVIFTQKFSVYGFAVPIPTESGGGSGGTGSGGTGSGGSTLYPVYTEASGNGSVSSSHDKAAGGTRVTITVVPEEGCRLGELVVTDKNGRQIQLTQKDGVYTFIMPNSAVYVQAGFIPAVAAPEDTGVADWLNTEDHVAYMTGYDNKKFGPNDNVTRAQVAQMFYRLLKDPDVAITASFKDVPADAWYATAVHTLATLGVVAGAGDGRFEPDRAITRAEFATIAASFAKEAAKYPVRFQDVPESFWAYQYISTAAGYGWVSGMGGDRFAPNDKITRAQAAVIINRMTGRWADKTAIDHGAGDRFPDVFSTHWAWYDIIEAATTHDYTKQDMGETWKK